MTEPFYKILPTADPDLVILCYRHPETGLYDQACRTLPLAELSPPVRASYEAHLAAASAHLEVTRRHPASRWM